MSARSDAILQQLAARFPWGHHQRLLAMMEEINWELGGER